MTTARAHKINLESTPYYHCVTRCVRRSYLCGTDAVTGNNYNHRKPWLINRFKFLAKVFAIDICAYAVMSNHYHLVLHVNLNQSLAWSKDEVKERWAQLFPRDANLFDEATPDAA
ncbi:MAG TPA: transposase, partial [Gammaproteobacteria bacterium]|nr:transposase [Gammaproteobacteria bacterium]